MLDIAKFLALAITCLALVAEASWFRKGFEVKENLVLLDSKIYQPVLRTAEARELSKGVEICKTDIFNLKLTCYRQEFDDGAQAKKRPAIVKLSQYLQGNYRVTINRGRQSRKFKIKKAIDMFGTHVEDLPTSDSLFDIIVDCPNSSVHAKIINVETGKVVRTLPIHDGRFIASALERDRQYIMEIFAYTRRLRKFIRRPKIIYREYVNRMYKPEIETDKLNIVFDSHYNAEWFGIFPPAEEATNEVVDGSPAASAVEEEPAGVPQGNLMHGYPGIGEITPTGSEEIAVPPTSPAGHDSSVNYSGVDMDELLERLSVKASKGSSSSSSSFRSPLFSDLEFSSGPTSGYSSSASSGVPYHKLNDDETDKSPEFQAEQLEQLLPAGSQSSNDQYRRRSRSSSVDSFEGGYPINALANQRKDDDAEDAKAVELDSDLEEDLSERSSFASSSFDDLSRTKSFDRAHSAFSLDSLNGDGEGSRDGPEQAAASIAQLNAEDIASEYDSDLEGRIPRRSSFASSISGTRSRKSSFDGAAHSPLSLDGEQLVSSQSQTIGSGEVSHRDFGSQAKEEMGIRDSADVAEELSFEEVKGAKGAPAVAYTPSTFSIKTAGRQSQAPQFTSRGRFPQQRLARGDEDENSGDDDGASDETALRYVPPYVRGYTVVDAPVPETQGQRQKGLLHSVQRAMSSFFAPNEPKKLRTPFEHELLNAVKARSSRIN